MHNAKRYLKDNIYIKTEGRRGRQRQRKRDRDRQRGR